MLNTYEQLKTAILNKLETQAQDSVNYVPTAVWLAEERVSRDIGYERISVVEDFEVQDDDIREMPVIVGDFYMGPSEAFEIFKVTTNILPDQFLSFENVYVNVFPNVRQKLTRVDMSFIEEFLNSSENNQIPRYYSYEKGDPTQIYLAPCPTSNLNINQIEGIRCEYNRKPDKLSDSNSTNILLKKVPDLLFAAGIIEMCSYIKNFEDLPNYKSEYQSLLLQHAIHSQHERKDVGKDYNRTDINDQNVTKK